jgi:hypothetical protein
MARLLALFLLAASIVPHAAFACTPTSRTKTLPPASERGLAIDILDGWGRVGSRITELRLSFTETVYDDCTKFTTYQLTFRQSNPSSQKGSASASIDFLDEKNNPFKIGRVSVPINRTFCGPYSPPYYKEFAHKGKIDNLIDSVFKISLRAGTVGGRIGDC